MSYLHTLPEQALHLAQIVQALHSAGFEVCSASLAHCAQPGIRVRCTPHCWAMCAAGHADYYTVGTAADLIHYRIGHFTVEGCRVDWEEWGEAIAAADRFLERSQNNVETTGFFTGSTDGGRTDAGVQ